MLLRRRGLSKIGILPMAYQQVEYIESTGTQYINTQFVPTVNTEFEIKAYYNQKISSSDPGLKDGYGVIMGTRTSSTSYTFNLSGYNTYASGYFGYGNNIRISANIKTQQINEFSLKNGTFTANGVSTKLNSYSYPTNIGPIYIFNLNENNSVYTEWLWGRVYYLKFWDNHILVRNFIPCYRKSDNKPGMYDIVTKTFYTNSGSGEFKLGPISIEKKYIQQVEYIEGTGTQYIDTNLQFDSKNKYIIDFQKISNEEKPLAGVAASTDWTSGSNFSITYTNNSNNMAIYCRATSNSSSASSAGTYGTTRHIFEIQPCPNGYLKIDGASISYVQSSFTKEDWTSKYSMFLFSRNNVGSSTSPAKARIYGFSITNPQNKVIHNFVPCYLKSDTTKHTAGMYDLVNKKFYINKGTGYFNVGSNT